MGRQAVDLIPDAFGSIGRNRRATAVSGHGCGVYASVGVDF